MTTTMTIATTMVTTDEVERRERERILAIIAEEKVKAKELNNILLSATLAIIEAKIRMGND